MVFQKIKRRLTHWILWKQTRISLSFFTTRLGWCTHPFTRSKALLEKYCKKLGVDYPSDPNGWSLKGQRNPFYCAMVEMLDHYVGQIISYLETTPDPRRPGHFLMSNTYIIFTSDNGGMEKRAWRDYYR